MEPEGSFPCFQDPDTGPYHQLHEFSAHLPTLLL